MTPTYLHPVEVDKLKELIRDTVREVLQNERLGVRQEEQVHNIIGWYLDKQGSHERKTK